MVTHLPDAAWRHRAGLDRLVAALGAGNARWVGGAVRDTLLGRDVSDLDLATLLAPEEVIRRCTDAGIRTIPTGIAHGTVTAVSAGTVVEVTTLRRDVSTDGRHAVIAPTSDWREDAARRDFTMNALYADPATGEVFDWFGGLADLAAGRVRFIGDPYQRIAEDHLRILRFFRFHARFGDAIDGDGLEACAARANDLMALSRERIAAELLKLLVAPAAVPVVALMAARGIFRPVLPEIDGAGVARLATLAEREAAAGIAPDAVRRLAALVPAAAAEAVGARLKLSNADRRRLLAATAGAGDEGPRALAYRVGAEIARDRLLLADADVAPLAGWTPPALPLSGGALVARGLAKGPDVARALKAVETRWIAEGFPAAARVEELADEEVANALTGR
ncbi:CCA tRNA nucleotidyltransferase [Sphingomonas corticis]|jgi:poly(A) polymerase|uniref:CCA tRNA nucleotidyltransferase n=1 Tax=Sphingomonas corticis TaxID=2722791 RepID=A0ABX1CT16_9SPHN|nr:CCA tRNA nucleotidyltransferase [Sphingomonas corticis]NJR79931.1 CCA tRNA nucleotidyltransferase [Sphingomonas corticis]